MTYVNKFQCLMLNCQSLLESSSTAYCLMTIKQLLIDVWTKTGRTSKQINACVLYHSILILPCLIPWCFALFPVIKNLFKRWERKSLVQQMHCVKLHNSPGTIFNVNNKSCLIFNFISFHSVTCFIFFSCSSYFYLLAFTVGISEEKEKTSVYFIFSLLKNRYTLIRSLTSNALMLFAVSPDHVTVKVVTVHWVNGAKSYISRHKLLWVGLLASQETF